MARKPVCPGDCGHDRGVTVDELVIGVDIALGLSELDACLPFDMDGDGAVTVDELIAAVHSSLEGCQAP
jgi:hypothetical protein